MKKKLREKIKNVPKHIWILVGIILLGIFVRTYNFHAWLEFKGDQARDAGLVYDVVNDKTPWPLLGPAMGSTGTNSSNVDGFHLGPFYYYLQIIAAKIFGDYPDKLAYFDLFFSILTIPLFYFFLKKYFSKNLSLVLTGLYTFSYFAILYSRFAWNPNPIPFFVLLFLLALNELLSKSNLARWKWVVVLGITVGVGVQLHAILLILFPLVSFIVCIYLLLRDPGIWKKWAIVFLIVVFLNIPQIVSEINTHFTNSQIFFNSLTGKNNTEEPQVQNNFFVKVGNNLDCHAEANFYMLTSLGQDNCSYYFTQIFSANISKGLLRNMQNFEFDLVLLCSLLLLPLGSLLFILNIKNQHHQKKKIFLQIIAIYLGVSLLVMFPIIKGKLEFRYFNYAFFMPFIFLGFFIDYLHKEFPRKYLILSIVLFFLVLLANVSMIAGKINQITDNNIINTHLVTLGDMESVIDYMKTNSGDQSNFDIGGDPQIISFAFSPLKYLSQKQNIQLTEFVNNNALQKNKLVYYLSNKPPSGGEYQQINKIYIFKLSN